MFIATLIDGVPKLINSKTHYRLDGAIPVKKPREENTFIRLNVLEVSQAFLM